MKKDKKLSEYYGTQNPSFAGNAGRNAWHGADLGSHKPGSLGTRGADSNFSRLVMQRIVPEDLYDEEESEEEVDEDIVVENSVFSLERTLDLIKEQDVIDMTPDDDDIFRASFNQLLSDPTELSRLDRSLGDYAYEVGTELVLRDLASSTVIGDEVVAIIRILFNVFVQIRSANNQIEEQEKIVEKYLEFIENNPESVNAQKEKHLQAIQSHISKLESLQQGLSRDLADLGQAVIALFPDDAAGPTAAIESILGKSLEVLPELLDQLEITDLSELEAAMKTAPEFTGLRYTVTALSALKAISNFAPLALGLPGAAITVLSLLNVNIFNPAKIVTAGVRSMFVTILLQNRLLVAHSQIESGGAFASDAPSTPENLSGEEYSDGYTSGEEQKQGEILRKLFISKPGDRGLFAESLNNRKLTYLLEDEEKTKLYVPSDREMSQSPDSSGENVPSDDEAPVEEISGTGAVGIGTLPLGASTKSSSGQHSSKSGGKAYPYSKSTQRQFKKYARKTFGGK